MIDLLEVLGISPVASSDRAFYPVSLLSATGRDVYAELTALGISIPTPPPIPKDATQWIGLQYLEHCWMEAAKWVDIKEDKRRHGPNAWRSFLQKDRGRDAMFAAVDALHELREKGSGLSPALWCWWRLSQMLEKGEPPFFFYSVWNANALRSPRMRRWHYEEVAADILCKKKLWPAQASRAFALVKAFTERASAIATEAEQGILWESEYAAKYNTLVQSAGFTKTTADTRLSDRAAKNDLGVWLSADLVVYLKLPDVALSMTERPSPLTTTVRRKKLGAGG